MIDSPFRRILEDLRAHITANTTMIDEVWLFNNQYEELNERRERPKSRGVVYVEYIPVLFEDRQGGCQVGDVTVVLHVALRTLDDRNALILDARQEVFAAVNGFAGPAGSSDAYTRLTRSEEEQNTDHDGISIWKLFFKTTVTDATGGFGQFPNETVITDDRDLDLTVDPIIDNPEIGTGVLPDS